MTRLRISDRQKITEFLFYLFCFFSIFLISACGGGDDESSYESSEAEISETGSIAFRVEWWDMASTHIASRSSRSDWDCEDHGVATLEGQIYDGAGYPPIAEDEWNCSEHEGIMYDVPAGSDMSFTLLGKDAGENVLCRGEVKDITVVLGQTTDLGIIKCLLTWYEDSDGDGYSDGTSRRASARPGTDYYIDSELEATFGDCNDEDADIYPGATEISYDGIDQDCDGSDYYPILWYKDSDGDGYSDGTYQTSETRPGTDYYKDSELEDTSGDCNDEDADVYPGATEISCDDIDQDCDGSDSCHPVWYKDSDGDGYSDGTDQSSPTRPGSDYYRASDLKAVSGDCNDNDARVHPGAAEISCDDIDQDCDGRDSCLISWYKDSDGDGYSDGTTQRSLTRPGSDYYEASEVKYPSGDCNDNNARVHPGAAEISCDDIDQDCDGSDSCLTSWYKDSDGDGYSDGTSQSSPTRPGSDYYKASDVKATSGDCNDEDVRVHPGAAEISCDEIDQDCDGSDSCYPTWYRDFDGDGYPDGTVQSPSAWWPEDDYYDASDLKATSGDCNDEDVRVHPEAVEICDDNKDNDCNGATDCDDPKCAEDRLCGLDDYAIDREIAITNGDINLSMARVSKDYLNNGADYDCLYEETKWRHSFYNYENVNYDINHVSYVNENGQQFATIDRTISYSYNDTNDEQISGEKEFTGDIYLILEDGMWKVYGNQQEYQAPSASPFTCSYADMTRGPIDPKEIFTASDDAVYVYGEFHNVRNGFLISMKWYRPDGNLEATYDYSTNYYPGYPDCYPVTTDYYTYLTIQGNEAFWRENAGTWRVDICVNDVVVEQLHFEYVEDW
ncbi:MopE-related protein [Desulfobacterales bacterium HSG2]|nr:MopE-related protein [Desulfobacterales bacterium HSG2]